METIKLTPPPAPPIAPVTPRIRRRLEEILHIELAYSITRKLLVSMDEAIKEPFSVDICPHGLNVRIMVYIKDDSVLYAFLSTYPNVFVSDGSLVLGEPSGPCVHILIERCLSGIDTHGEATP